jgi:hypothetical protein
VAAGAEGVDRGPRHGGHAGRVEGVRQAGAAGELGEAGDDVLLLAVDRVRGAELEGEVEPFGHDVDGDEQSGLAQGGRQAVALSSGITDAIRSTDRSFRCRTPAWSGIGPRSATS